MLFMCGPTDEQEPTWREVFSKMNRRAVLVGCGLMFFQVRVPSCCLLF